MHELASEADLPAELKAALSTGDYGTAPFAPQFEVEGRAVPGISMHGSQAVACWQIARERYAETGCWPILVGDDEELERVREHLEYAESHTSDILAKAETMPGANWLDQRVEEQKDFYGDDWYGATPPRGEWIDDEIAHHGFTIPYNILNRQPLERVWLLLVPVANCWEVPAVLRYGDWNDCPEPAGHVAMFRYWNEKYGAEPVGMSGDVVEMYVPRPPANREAAIALATEQYTYCADIVEQGTETIDALAAALLNGSTWYFWWD